LLYSIVCLKGLVQKIPWLNTWSGHEAAKLIVSLSEPVRIER